MLQVTLDKSVQILETIVQKLEQYDQLQKRPRVFAKSGIDEDDRKDQDDQADKSHSSHGSNSDDVQSSKTKLK